MIYLCRHGQTEFNAIGRRPGQVDSDLTAQGRAQASAMGHKLQTLTLPDFRIFASPLGRAHHSARLIAAALLDGVSQTISTHYVLLSID